jgi:putative PIN family toxin of toxin-antitoxin system
MTEPECWVVDTNVLVSRLLLPTSTPARALDLMLQQGGVLLFSNATLVELTEVLSRPKFDRFVTLEDRRTFVRLLGGISRIVPIVRSVEACRDPDDNKFLDVALAGPSKAIVTGDLDLLALNPFHGIEIMTPGDALVLLDPTDD